MDSWCGGSDPDRELASIQHRTGDLVPIGAAEYAARRRRLQDGMAAAGLDALYLDAGSSLAYFTGVSWHNSERLCGAVLPCEGEPSFVVPFFEGPAFAERLTGDADVVLWHEHDSPERMLADRLGRTVRLGLDPQTPFGRAERLRAALRPGSEVSSAEPLITACRSRKSPAEIALMQRAFDITLSVQAAAARILRPGITTGEVTRFIDDAHRAAGAPGGSFFCIVLFGPDTSFPHGVASPKALDPGDTVLVDTGCTLHGYGSDMTRTYVFGTPTERQRRVWTDERAAQDAAFAAAWPGRPCEEVDAAVRACLAERGYGPDYALPGLPHRTGHGLGLDIHEPPFFVRGDTTPLAEGMCVSVEPMLCLPGEFGIRLEDHIHMTAAGPVWFTEPAASIDAPFATDGRS